MVTENTWSVLFFLSNEKYDSRMHLLYDYMLFKPLPKGFFNKFLSISA